MSEAALQDKRQSRRGKAVFRVGMVVSDKGEKTIKVECRYMVRHPKYAKYMKRRKSLHAHDEKGEAKLGDLVEVSSCRRVSKTKCWRLTRILRSI